MLVTPSEERYDPFFDMRSVKQCVILVLGILMGACSAVPSFSRIGEESDAPDATIPRPEQDSSVDAEIVDAGIVDAQQEDAAVDASVLPLTVFVTPDSYRGNELGTLPGGAVAGTDTVCTAHGREATGSTVRRWVAWLSLSSVTAASRLGQEPGPWVDLSSGETVFAISPASSGRPRSLLRTPAGVPTGAEFIWTGTSGSGQPRATCDDWRDFQGTATVGYPGSVDGGPPANDSWTEGRSDIVCNVLLPLYCFELRAAAGPADAGGDAASDGGS